MHAEGEPELERAEGREYSSVRSTGFHCSPVRSMYSASCAKAAASACSSRTSTTPHALGRYSHLCASTVIESARSSPRNSGRRSASPLPAGRTRRRRAARRRGSAQTSAMPSRSIDGAGQRRAAVGDDGDRRRPGRAIRRDGARPALRRRGAAARPPAARPCRRSRCRAPRSRAPRSRARRWRCRSRGSTSRRPRRREPGTARSRAAASAVMFETVPPLVTAPARPGKPTNSPTQRSTSRSIAVAAPP